MRVNYPPTNNYDEVVLVDTNDRVVGSAEKIYAHQTGLLHRAFSIFIIQYLEDKTPQILLQQRAAHKYHSCLLWSNTCCSHPRQHEDILTAGQRRLHEELGISCSLATIGNFIYHAQLDTGLIEHEFDHVLCGILAPHTNFIANPAEIHATRWAQIPNIIEEVNTKPHLFTPWFADTLQILIRYLGINASPR